MLKLVVHIVTIALQSVKFTTFLLPLCDVWLTNTPAEQADGMTGQNVALQLTPSGVHLTCMRVIRKRTHFLRTQKWPMLITHCRVFNFPLSIFVEMSCIMVSHVFNDFVPTACCYVKSAK
jgi:hypothetical protein